MSAKRCAHCGASFHPRPQVPNQAFCSSRDCQRARKRQWQQARLGDDPDYRENQRTAQRSWQARNPGYWRQYRGKHGQAAPQAGSAKMDVSIALPAGLYRIRKSAISAPKTSDFWLFEVAPVCLTCPCKMDV
jgi:hypothetical protein